jgi:hypothetical protein
MFHRLASVVAAGHGRLFSIERHRHSTLSLCAGKTKVRLVARIQEDQQRIIH